jgi:hypothetical protein
MNKFVSYLTDYGGSLSDNRGSLSVTCPTVEEVCQLLDQQWRKFVSCLSDNGGSLSVT